MSNEEWNMEDEQRYPGLSASRHASITPMSNNSSQPRLAPHLAHKHNAGSSANSKSPENTTKQHPVPIRPGVAVGPVNLPLFERADTQQNTRDNGTSKLPAGSWPRKQPLASQRMPNLPENLPPYHPKGVSSQQWEVSPVDPKPPMPWGSVKKVSYIRQPGEPHRLVIADFAPANSLSPNRNVGDQAENIRPKTTTGEARNLYTLGDLPSRSGSQVMPVSKEVPQRKYPTQESPAPRESPVPMENQGEVLSKGELQPIPRPSRLTTKAMQWIDPAIAGNPPSRKTQDEPQGIVQEISTPSMSSDVSSGLSVCSGSDAEGAPLGRVAKDKHTQASMASDAQRKRFVEAWMDRVPYDTRVVNLSSNYWGRDDRDIDTEGRVMLEPVDYPHTIMDPAGWVSEGWHHCIWNSYLISRREVIKTARQNELSPPQRTGRTEDREAEVFEETKPEEPDPFAPQVPCYMRPARKEDMINVAAIYNWEVVHGTQALDIKPLFEDDLERLLEKTRELEMPFVVMVKKSPVVPTKKTHLQLRHNMPQEKETRVIHQANAGDEILGFGFLSEWQPGLAGGGSGTSRTSARVHVYVHPDYRRMKIGASILDKLMMTASESFGTSFTYEWHDSDDDPVYKTPREHKRKYGRLYIQYLVRSKSIKKKGEDWSDEEKAYDADLKWLDQFLKSPFWFFEFKDRFDRGHLSGPKAGEQPFPMDAIIYQHDCTIGSGR